MADTWTCLECGISFTTAANYEAHIKYAEPCHTKRLKAWPPAISETEQALLDAAGSAPEAFRSEVWKNVRGDLPQARTDVEPFDLTQLPFVGLRRVGAIFLEGAQKYGVDNWRKGAQDKSFQIERSNHALKHLLLFVHALRYGEDITGEAEDHLAKVAWFCLTQMELERLQL